MYDEKCHTIYFFLWPNAGLYYGLRCHNSLFKRAVRSMFVLNRIFLYELLQGFNLVCRNLSTLNMIICLGLNVLNPIGLRPLSCIFLIMLLFTAPDPFNAFNSCAFVQEQHIHQKEWIYRWPGLPWQDVQKSTFRCTRRSKKPLMNLFKSICVQQHSRSTNRLLHSFG